jgi:hypothetical protein
MEAISSQYLRESLVLYIPKMSADRANPTATEPERLPHHAQVVTVGASTNEYYWSDLDAMIFNQNLQQEEEKEKDRKKKRLMTKTQQTRLTVNDRFLEPPGSQNW